MKYIKPKMIAAYLLLSLSSIGSAMASIPGMKGPDHMGFTVPNVSEAVEFFVEIMGCEPFYQLGPFADDKGDWMNTHLNVHPRATIPAIQLLRCANGSNLELFEYTAPNQNKQPAINSDIAGHHIGFYVEDMDAAVEYLKAQGIEVQGEPSVMTTGPSAGESWVYFLSPWGMQLELVSYPNGKAYEKDTQRRLFAPNR